ncbi:glycosyltransferase involved in cell wall biosynthesis [Nitrobacteraceae bacterium AZCC 2161]
MTVVIPNYNYARYLPDAVHSTLSQPGVTVDIIIVDDASTDNSVEVARELAAEDERIRVLVHKANAGPVATFNDGLAEARGEFLVRLDADDILTPGSLERAVAVAQHFPSVGLVYGHPLHFSGVARRPARTKPAAWTIWPGRKWLADRCRDGFNVITSPEVLMRKSVVDIVGGQRPLAHTHDMEMWLRLSAFADVAYIHGVDQAWHRDHAESLSARKVDRFRDLTERRDAFRTLFSGKAGGLAEADQLRRASMRAIAAQALEEAVYAYSKGTADRRQVERYKEIARTAVEDVETLPEWLAVQKWMAISPQQVASHPIFFLRRAHRRLRSEIAWRRWHRSGVF